MKWQFEDRSTNAFFTVYSKDHALKGTGMLNGGDYMNTIVLNPGAPQAVHIDNIAYTMPGGSILPLVANQHFIFERPADLVAWQFNRGFYCIVDHDAELGCAGFLFYGIRHPFFILLPQEELNAVLLLEKLCIEDMLVRDKMQGDMLRTLLQRLIIRVTRIAKKQTAEFDVHGPDKYNLIRNFNLLVECHYRTQHEVRYYARAMNKAPKTLSNLFAQYNYDPPSKCIRNRILLEARRYLIYTDKSMKEVADELGFTSMAHFSKFFKNNTGINFSQFKIPQPGYG